MSSFPNPIFFWSLPNEPGFADAFRLHHINAIAVPMTADGVRTARLFFTEEEVQDPVDLFKPGERQAIDAAVIDFENSLRHAITSHRSPWLRSLCWDTTRMVCDSTFYTWAIMGRLSERCNFDYARIYPSFTQLYQPLHRRVEEYVLKASIADMHNTAWEPKNKRRVRQLLLRIRQLLGKYINWLGGLLMTETVAVDIPATGSDIVVAGLLRTDVHAQHTLVQRLRERAGDLVTWYCFTGGSLMLSHDESMRNDQQETDMIRVPEVERHRWRWNCLDSLSKENLIVELHAVIDRVGLSKPFMPPHASRILASALIEFHPQLRLVYESVARLMEAANPRLVVANCNVGMMAFAREWSRSKNITYVKIPHAFQYDPTYHYEWDADVLGVLGPWLAERIQDEKLDNLNLNIIGGADLSEQALACRAAETGSKSFDNVCFLLSELGRTDYPDTEAEIERDTIALARNISAVGKRLAVRCHPRSKIRWFYKKLCEQETKEGAPCIMLDAQESLTDQLNESIAAVIRITSSSAVMALFLRVPIIGFVPRPGRKYSDEFLMSLPLHASDVQEVGAIVKKLSDNHAYVETILGQQDEFLAELIENPMDDPYDRAIQMIMKNLESARR